ncbi:mannose-6-phosphate isomerase [Candidatus Pacearchaeota archaeon]|nr:mannose-6-phosphate isomerase [Candidatus Pacearchaeota archaeon]|tara:strand:- start:9657 stop:10145 length:489 start_codon:yes stop_codon:yes gene_type:complete
MQYRYTCCQYITTSLADRCPACGKDNPNREEVDKEDEVFLHLPSFSGDKPYETRPWGSFRVLLDEPEVKVKKITVKTGQRLSLQLHTKRDELWSVISGCGTVQVGNKSWDIGHGSIVKINKYDVHRVKSDGLHDLIFVEIQTGKCQEGDIVRIEDDYDRTEN